MARSENPNDGGEIWGTWEELLLACAVSRHGTRSWDSVAMEVQTRSPFATRLTPHSCRLRFRLLHRRFSSDSGGGDDEPDAGAADGWVEELRKLRVAELRREVERYDLSIGSLQTKVKRLKEERERGLRTAESGEAEPDLEGKQVAGSPEEVAGDRISGEDSGRSCKESNSTDLKSDRVVAAGDVPATGAASGTGATDLAAGEGTKQEGSYDDSSGESGESVAESKEVEAGKESSDVQSSASLSRRRRKAAPSAEEASVPSLAAADSEALLAFLEMVRSTKAVSVFERRLESQESGRYRSTIRRHVDLEMVRAKLDGTCGSGAAYASASEFYRDLLLLCANALVFFPPSSPESTASSHLRALVTKQLTLHKQQQQQQQQATPCSTEDQAPTTTASKLAATKPKSDPDIAGSLLEKAPPLIVCRKRSSIAKAAAAAASKEGKPEKAEPEEKPEKAEPEKSGGSAGKKATKAATTRGLRTSKSRASTKNSNTNPPLIQKPTKNAESPAADSSKKTDKKNSGGSSGAASSGPAKKRNAVDFLNRMNQSSPSTSTARVSLLETLKRSSVAEQKKGGKGDSRKEQGSGSKKASAELAPAKRSVGRPPKRTAAPPTPPPAKRAKEEAAKSSSSKKRGRR